MSERVFTEAQVRVLERWDRAPWRWFMSDARYHAMEDRFAAANEAAAVKAEKDREAAYYAVLSRVVAYTGPDYRVRLPGQSSWIRASELQWRQAEVAGLERRIGVPELVAA